jgi:tellurite resistance protein TerC
MIELADLAFSLDNVIAAVALSDRLWVVILGIAIGMVLMRFTATRFTLLIEWEPALERAAFLLIFAIGGKLLLEHLGGIEINEWVQFGISIGIILLVLLFARVKLFKHLTFLFRPFVWLFVWINTGLSYCFGLLAYLWRFAFGLLRVRNTSG